MIRIRVIHTQKENPSNLRVSVIAENEDGDPVEKTAYQVQGGNDLELMVSDQEHVVITEAA